MTPDLLASLAGILISLACSYLPGVAPRYAALDPTSKRLVMAIALLGVSMGAFGLACVWGGGLAGPLGIPLVCDGATAATLLRTLVLALAANQGMFLIAPRGGVRGGDAAWDQCA